jgi:hypothetical protein
MFTVAGETKFAPLIVTAVPPPAPPEAGSVEVTEGFAERISANASTAPDRELPFADQPVTPAAAQVAPVDAQDTA